MNAEALGLTTGRFMFEVRLWRRLRNVALPGFATEAWSHGKSASPLLLVLYQRSHLPPHRLAFARKGWPLPPVPARHAARAPAHAAPLDCRAAPKLAFFPLGPASFIQPCPKSPRDDTAGGLSSGGPPLADPADSPEPELMGGGAGPAVLSPDEVRADDAQAP